MPLNHCPKCPPGTPTTTDMRTFRSGDVHRRLVCGKCGRFLRYIPRTAVHRPAAARPGADPAR